MEEIKIGYTRVTEIIGWYKSLIHGAIDENVLKAKAQLGTNVHEAIAMDGEGVFIPLSEKELPYFNSYLQWKFGFRALEHSRERRFYCDKLKITGAIDLIAEATSEKFLVDFKTSAAVDMKGWELQAQFYHYLCAQNGIDLTHMRFVKLEKDGKKPRIVEFKPSKEGWKIAEECLRVYRFWNEKK